MLTDDRVRVDKWLWSVRIFKTRHLASEACAKGRVLIDDQPVKASRILKPDDIVHVKKPPVVFAYRVKGLLARRLSAKAVQDYVEDVTPAAELDKLKLRETFFVVREKGSGRPTKKERRTLDRLKDEMD